MSSAQCSVETGGGLGDVAPWQARPYLLRAPKDRVLVESGNPSAIEGGTPLIFLDIDGVLNRTK